MKKIYFICIAVLLFQISVLSQTKNLIGNWLGKLNLPGGVELTIVFKISEKDAQKSRL